MDDSKIKVTIEYTKPGTNEREIQKLECDMVLMQGLTYGSKSADDPRDKVSTAIVGDASPMTLLDMLQDLTVSVFRNAHAKRSKSN